MDKNAALTVKQTIQKLYPTIIKNYFIMSVVMDSVEMMSKNFAGI